MKKYSLVCTTFTMLVFALLFTGCLKDTCKYKHSYTFYEPVYRTSAEVRANIKSNPPAEIKAPGKIVILGNYIFLNEINKGIHVLDNSNPSSPKNIAFIDIPGNLDLAVKGTSLYADLYTDLVTLDISNPLNVVKTNITDGVFPVRYYEGAVFGDSGKILYAWIKRDTTIIEDCEHPGLVTVPGAYFAQDFSAGGYIKSNSAPIGTGGSMARFALINNYLYTVGDMDLNAFNITNSKQPVFADKLQVDFHLETLYPFGNKLFIGANNGMFIYNVSSSPGHPVKVGEFTHARSCDPVIADQTFAYVTLHSGTTCLGFNNELDIVQLNDLSNSQLVKIYNLTAPQGLSKDGDILFICDGTDGLKVYNARDVMNLQLIKQFPGPETYDVIANNKIAIVVAKDGLYQYDYSSLANIHLVSKINISN